MTKHHNNMRGKKALITGAGSGIGKAAAIALAKAGATVAILSRTTEQLNAVLRQIGDESGDHFLLKADVASEAEMIAACDEITRRWGVLDIVVANAGINGVWAPLEKLTVDEWDQTIAINLRGTFLTTKLTLPLLRKRGGSVIVVSSINGNRIFSNTGATAYSCSKAAQVAFAKMTALELAKDRIRVNVICPGAIKTQIDDSTERRDTEDLHLPVKFPEGDIPLTDGKPGSPQDVANLICFLASDASSHISGTEIYIDGAQSLLQG